ncbi:uncharacterized protein L203_106022 [Cryptococcus depauperatus CBS 7841]|uniref:Mediator of RNA polymerase II transcription subunit 31 n=1 Tax=Cryptococcus depauperatus CBS 7841 TaxID=1295531 RepID=A0A1E3IV54_9TREE|nr:hypothetical protein L203_00729 [Cryptococcus depauperatus CBS 7841]
MQSVLLTLPPPPLPDGSEAPPRSPEKEANLVRFQSELEFVQCLANPMYLQELHTQGYLYDSAFLNYLQYMEYWRDPEYIRFITYPTCLVYLTLLQTELFRMRIADSGFIQELMRVATRYHATWRTQKPSKEKAIMEESIESSVAPDKGEKNEDPGNVDKSKKLHSKVSIGDMTIP